jgi:hypothetical protein
MKWHDVASSSLSRVAYEPSSMVMSVEFHNGTVYEYFDIPQTLFEQLVAAGSAGQFLVQNVKGTYRYARA